MSIIEKFSDMIKELDMETDELQIGEFWNSDRTEVNEEEFKVFIQEKDLYSYFQEQEIDELIALIRNQDGMISLSTLVRKIPFWNS